MSLLRSVVAPRSALTLARPLFRSGPIRSLTYTNRVRKGISPESEDPHPHEPESNAPHKQAAELTAAQYQELSEEYMNMVVEKLEELQEEREDVDVEYSAGVLNLTFPPIGTYVINKQPPNKQIWLSSPISGPKRYDFVVTSEGQDSKEGTGEGEWIYLRDGSSLNELLLKEIGVDLSRSYTPEMQGDE
ncbi:mitochondrial iron uptake protein [Rutstroemia sp. NJR-2017a BVV2]|nr:mitochondrial iron uptake protein [Rutstroemia sp. NJR-2017a BVV2]